MGIRQLGEDFENGHPGWFTAGHAGFDFDKGLAHTGKGNAWGKKYNRLERDQRLG
jgi:hypothetical protein